MSLYNLNVGDLPQISDVNQLTDMFNGKHDTGAVTFAPQLSTPSITGVSASAQVGTSLGIGAYNYQLTAVTGYYKTNGTLQKTGETPVSSAVALTTTSGNQAGKITLPTTGLPTSQVAWGIYRTAVGGSTYGLVATVKVGNASYTDTTTDGNRGAVPPTTNTTGITIILNGGSVPSIIASGTNSNGTYIQYSDGTMICYWTDNYASTSPSAWTTVTGQNNANYYYVPGQWTYPAAFKSGTTVSCHMTGDINGAYLEAHHAFPVDNTHCNTESGCYYANVVGYAMQRQYYAIGVWK